jgi:hypothetical protein
MVTVLKVNYQDNIAGTKISISLVRAAVAA